MKATLFSTVARHKRKGAIIGVLLVLAMLGYWFFMHTNRGSSWALYAFAGIHAPLKVKLACAGATDARVHEKFLLPLDFTPSAKNDLRGFWYYSYYRSCLFEHGYDFSGRPVPVSAITDGQYRNAFVGIQFDVPVGATIETDNLLNVDFDDHLYASNIHVGNDTITIHAYLRDDRVNNLEQIEHLSTRTEAIIGKETVTNPQGVTAVHALDSGAAGIAFQAPAQWTVFIYGPRRSEPVLGSLFQSLQMLSSK